VTALVIDYRQRKRLADLRALANRHPVNAAELPHTLATDEGKVAHLQVITSQTIELPVGFLLSFTVETGHPCGTIRHMTLSVMRVDRIPTPEACELVAAELGFVGGLAACMRWTEQLQGHGVGVNLVQPVDLRPEGRA
jgi:hypothetical protein